MNFTISFENKKYDYESFMAYMVFKLHDEYMDKTNYPADNKKKLLFTIFIDNNEYQGMSFTEIFNNNCLHVADGDIITMRGFGCIENMKNYLLNQGAALRGKHRATVIMTRF